MLMSLSVIGSDEESMEEAKCRFCGIAKKQYYHDEIDEPFAINEEYMAVASIGALVEGWTLIIPQVHQLSMIDHYERSEFELFVRKVIPPLVDRYGSLISFEHGSNKEGSITACGTDHAHLHLVPFTGTLIPDLNNSGLKWEHCLSSEIAGKAGKNEYLFYTELDSKKWRNPNGYLHVLEQPISQFFRKLIADRIGCPDMANYRDFPFLKNAMLTSKTLVEHVS